MLLSNKEQLNLSLVGGRLNPQKEQDMEDVYMRLFWVSYWTQFGDLKMTSILVPSNKKPYEYIENELQILYGDDFGDIADYDEYEEDVEYERI